MAGSLNRVTLIGNVGQEPEIRTTQDGKEIASFSLATSESWRDKGSGERKEKVEWHKIVVFSPHLINVVKNYTHKGSKLYIDGALQTRKWSDHGVEKYTTEVVLQQYNGTLIILNSRGDDAHGSHSNDNKYTSGTSNQKSYQVESMDDDEIPF